MRVVAGSLRGRALKAPAGTATRPTSDRVREAVFSRIESLAPEAIAGSRVLDAFAGSGALGIEALSRGAAGATFVERDRAALAALRANLTALGVERTAHVLAADVVRAAASGLLPGAPFALLFIDPPYRIDKSEVRALIDVLALTGALTDGALVIWEHATGDAIEWPERFEPHDPRRYGSTEVDMAIFRGGE
jgi:16S rRNA (guanine966-N2)-methyltransferase